jgi:hypothetical protein
VVFESKADALKAKSTFDNVALDGQPMKIELVQGQPGERTLSSGIRWGSGPVLTHGSLGYSNLFQTL